MISTLPAMLGSGAFSSLSTNIKLDDVVSLAIRMAIIGLLAAAVRHLFGTTRSYLYDSLFPTAHITYSDPAFEWIMSYLAQSPQAQRQIKSFRLITADARQSKRDDSNRLRTSTRKSENLSIARKDATFVDDVVGQISPVNERAIMINHKGAYIWVTRKSKAYANSDKQDTEEHLEITGLSFQSEGIKQFIIDAHALFFKKADNELLIFNVSPYTGNWIDPIHRPSRSWSSVILPESQKVPLLKDVKNFLSAEEKAWYGARGIPHRRGYLLHGKPGSGKTTLATAIASQLGLDIYIVNPAARGMDDGKLNKAFRNCPPSNMILLEDIDCVMPPRPRRGKGEEADDDDDDDILGDKDAADPGKYGLARSTVTLSGLLNAIDGVSSQEDCILFATTNHPERLDSALSRPGRFDVQLSFTDATFDQAKSLFKHFFPLSDFQSKLDVSSSPAAATAVENGLEKDNEKAHNDDHDVDNIKSEGDLEELSTKFAQGVFYPKPTTDSQAESTTPSEPNPSGEEEPLKVEIEFGISMAALQGFLLTHKKEPRLAAEKSSEWSLGLRREQEDKEGKRLIRKAKREKLKENLANGQEAGKTGNIIPGDGKKVNGN